MGPMSVKVGDRVTKLPWPPGNPPSVAVRFPKPRAGEDVVAVSRSLSPALVLEAYRQGIFPWPVRQGLGAWDLPEPRANFPLTPPRTRPRAGRRGRSRGLFSSS